METLYTTALSANGRKVLALVQHLGLAVEVKEVNVYRGEGRSADFLTLNPSGKIPVWVEDGFTLTESNAILQYLADAYPGHEPGPRTARERACVASWMFWEAAHWQPTLSSLLAPFVGARLLPDVVSAPAGAPDWHRPEVRALLARLEQALSDGAFLVGDRLTLADFAVAGMTTYFRATGFPFPEHPAFTRWYARLEQLPAWRATLVAPWG